MAVSILTATVPASTVKANRKSNRAKASTAPAPAAKPAPAPFSTPANCATLNVNPAVIDYGAWKKSALLDEYRRRFKREPVKSWTGPKLAQCLTADSPAVGRMKGAKDALRAKYRATVGVDAPKSWKCEVLESAIESGRKPGQRTAKGGLRVADCRRLISAAVSLGLISKESATGRSAWKAAALHAFVAEHKLCERFSAVK